MAVYLNSMHNNKNDATSMNSLYNEWPYVVVLNLGVFEPLENYRWISRRLWPLWYSTYIFCVEDLYIDFLNWKQLLSASQRVVYLKNIRSIKKNIKCSIIQLVSCIPQHLMEIYFYHFIVLLIKEEQMQKITEGA